MLKEIPSCPETMKYLKWTICRRRSAPFPVATEKETVASVAEGTCEMPQVVTCVLQRELLSASLSAGNQRFPATQVPRATLGTAIVDLSRSHAPFPICHQGGEVRGRIESFLNVSELLAGCDLTPGAMIFTGVKCLASNR